MASPDPRSAPRPAAGRVPPAVAASRRRARGQGGQEGPGGRATGYFAYCRKSSEAEDRQIQSIASQRAELQRVLEGQGVEVVAMFEEAQSARRTGRPVFNEMMSRIEAGEAGGIVAWAPDRLARNAADGAWIVELLDAGVIRDLKFATYTFENNSQGKFMLSIMFGQSKYYSDALSENVKRGNRAKAAKGWRPNSVPLGYRHDPATKTIVADPAYFPLVKRLFDLMLSGGYSARRLAQVARDEWGLRIPRHRKRGGQPVALSTIHKMLTNPFYAGLFTHEGAERTGRHEAVVSLAEFEQVQATLARPRPTRARRHAFPFTGLIRCGSCGRAVTAEHKVNRHGKRYTYYHCTKTGLGPRCPEPSVRAEDLEAQIVAWLRQLPLRPAAERRVLAAIEDARTRARSTQGAVRKTVEATLREAQAQITELLGLRVRRLISDEEFTARRADLQAEAARLARRLEQLGRADDEDLFEPVPDAISFSNQAADWFRRGDDGLKRLIVKAACSNPTLANKILSLEAADWLAWLENLVGCTLVRGRGSAVRTPPSFAHDSISALRTVVARGAALPES